MAYILIPTAYDAPNQGLLNNLHHPEQTTPNEQKHLTHILPDVYNDAIVKRINEQQLFNRKENKIKGNSALRVSIIKRTVLSS